MELLLCVKQLQREEKQAVVFIDLEKVMMRSLERYCKWFLRKRGFQ